MKKPINEQARLESLHSYGLIGTPPEKDFDELAEMASRICEVPMSAITLIDTAQQWMKSSVGLENKTIPREDAFCAHTILKDQIMIVSDTKKDQRFIDNPLVTGSPDIRFYAGMPLVNQQGFRLGALCVLDTKPHQLTETQQYYLSVLAKQVVKRMELHKKVVELERLNDANSKLMSVISHDFRSPLNSLYGLLELAEKFNLDQEEFKKFLPDIRRGFTATSVLLTNLLDWAATQFGQTQVTFSAIELHGFVKQVIYENKPQFDKKGNSVSNHIPQSMMGWVNENLLKAILRNLTLNANKFTDSGTIVISAEEKGDLIQISVQDSGIGIPSDRMARLFEWNTRSSTNGTAGEKGSGFGLQLCKEFVERGGGTLWATSSPGSGSTFYFTVPRDVNSQTTTS